MRMLGVALLLLAGCGGSESDNHGYGFAFDVQGATGLKLRFNHSEPPDQRTPVWIFESRYMDVQKCTGLTAPPPMVIDSANGDPGIYYSDPPLIVVTKLYAFNHEVIHYLLDYTTGDPDSNHKSMLFKKCS